MVPMPTSPLFYEGNEADERDGTRNLRRKWNPKPIETNIARDLRRKWNPKPIEPMIYNGNVTDADLTPILRGKLGRHLLSGGTPISSRDLRRKLNLTRLSP